MSKKRQPTPEDYLDRPVANLRDVAIWLEGLEYFFRHCTDCGDWAEKVAAARHIVREHVAKNPARVS